MDYNQYFDPAFNGNLNASVCYTQPGPPVAPQDSAIDLRTYPESDTTLLYSSQRLDGVGLHQTSDLPPDASTTQQYGQLLPGFMPVSAILPQPLPPVQQVQAVPTVHTAPQYGAPPPAQKIEVYMDADKLKTRAETQIKVTLRIDNLPSEYHHIRFPKKTLAKPKWIANADEKGNIERRGPVLRMELYCVCASALLKKEDHDKARARARGELPKATRNPDLPISQMSKDDPAHPQNGGEVLICDGCKERERKRHDRKKKKENEEEWLSYENDRIILINEKEFKPLKDVDPPMGFVKRSKTVDFNMRIACYCRHQEEKSTGGYIVIFVFKDGNNKVLTEYVSQVFSITDDHKNRETVYENPVAHALAGPPQYTQSQHGFTIPCEMPSYPGSRRESQTPAYSQPGTPMAPTFSQPQTPVSFDFSQPPTPTTGAFSIPTPFSSSTFSEAHRDTLSDINFSMVKQEPTQYPQNGLPVSRSILPRRGPHPISSRHSSTHLPISQPNPQQMSHASGALSMDAWDFALQHANHQRHVRQGANSMTNIAHPIDTSVQQFPHTLHQQQPLQQQHQHQQPPNGFVNSRGVYNAQNQGDLGPRAHSMMDLQSLRNCAFGQGFDFQDFGASTVPSTPVNLSRPPSPSWVEGPVMKAVRRDPPPPVNAVPMWANALPQVMPQY